MVWIVVVLSFFGTSDRLTCETKVRMERPRKERREKKSVTFCLGKIE